MGTLNLQGTFYVTSPDSVGDGFERIVPNRDYFSILNVQFTRNKCLLYARCCSMYCMISCVESG